MPRILIIDDDPTVRLAAELILGGVGFQVRGAADGEEGLARLREEVPDLVVCDLLLPGLDGRGVLAAAQGEPRLAGVPFLFLVSRPEAEVQGCGLALEAGDFLTKPFEPLDLVEAVQDRLHRTTAPRQGPPAPDPRRLEYWIRRIGAWFEEGNPAFVHGREDEILARKLTIHAAHLRARLYLLRGDRSSAEAEYAIAVNLLKVNAERFRAAVNDPGNARRSFPHRALRGKILRLERLLAEQAGHFPPA